MTDQSHRPSIGRPRTLPDDWILLQMRDAEGKTAVEIAREYGVTPQAVSKRFNKMGHPSRASYRDVLPWQMLESDLSLYAGQRLYSHIKERRGEELSPTVHKRLKGWQSRLERDCVVLDYRRVDIGSPWQYVPRIEADNRLVVRWPAEAPPPTELQRKLLELPTAK